MDEVAYQSANKVLKQIDYAIAGNDFSGIYEVFRGFLRNFFGIDYEFTIEELSSELSSIEPALRERIIYVYGRLESTVYSSEEIDKNLVESCRQIVVILMRQVSTSDVAKKPDPLLRLYQLYHRMILRFYKSEFFSEYYKGKEYLIEHEIGLAREVSRKLVEIYSRQPKDIQNKLFVYMGRFSEAIHEAEMNEQLRRIDYTFDKIYLLLNRGALDRAKEEYMRLKGLYYDLPEKKQGLVFKDMQKFYRKILRKEKKKLLQEVKAEIGRIQYEFNAGNDVEEAFDKLKEKVKKLDDRSVRKEMKELYSKVYSEPGSLI
ncbi:MAG: hypothetical protein ACLFP2_02100 [Candidatus Woesearchaeota archaeon]